MIKIIDIVAHSMGFAYATGMIHELKNCGLDISWDGFYIIAPENGCGGGLGTIWAEYWQYGSNYKQTDADPIFDQDGVAPQCAVIGIGNNRAFIPKDFQPKGFLNSHSISNYGWIFEQQSKDPGYVTPK
jgi:hypothetical protein